MALKKQQKLYLICNPIWLQKQEIDVKLINVLILYLYYKENNSHRYESI